MKLLQINKLYFPHLGGIENVVKDIAENLVNDDFLQSDVLVCQEKGARLVERINSVGITRAASFGRLFSLPISFDFFRLFKKAYQGYDILLIHHPFPLASFARFLFLNKKKVVAVWYHSDIVRQKLFYYFVYPFLYFDLKAASVIFVSSKRLAENSKLLSKFISKCRVIPFGVDLIKYNREYSETQKITNQYGRFMLSVGRLVYYKGYLDLIESMKNAPGKLLIIGTGPLESKIKEKIKLYNLEDRVVIISSHPKELIPFYKACDFLVFPSNERSEAFGLVQIEAMACGKPVINTNLKTGVPEISVNNETGITVAVGNVVKLTEAIKLLWEDNDLRIRMGDRAKDKVAKEYTKEKFNSDLNNALVDLVK